MNKLLLATTALAVLAAPAATQKTGKRSRPPQDKETRQAPDFRREGRPDQRAKKDPLEGKAPPPLQVTRWMNIKGKSLKLSKLKGKVIAIKFWGVW